MICPWDLVIIYWLDASDSENGWIDLATYKPESHFVITVGYVIPELLAGHISVTASFFPNETPDLKGCGLISHIPNGMVREIIVLHQPDIDLTSALLHP